MTKKNNFPDALIFNVDKPVGLSSFDVIRKLKRIIPGKGFKIGHFGTLDPFASGVLLIGYGHATRLMDYVHELMPKTYDAIGFLGHSTTTGDTEGEIKETNPNGEDFTADWNLEKLNTLFHQKFVEQEYWQTPPAFSATKHQGKALYKWAREGKMIVKDPVLRVIKSLEVTEFSPSSIKFSVTVSTGTYIRVLLEDMAETIGTLGHLTGLVRTSVGSTKVENSIKADFWELENNEQVELLINGGLKMQEFMHFQGITLKNELASKYRNGIPAHTESSDLSMSENSHGAIDYQKTYWVYDENQNMIGLGEIVDGLVKPVFNLPTQIDG